MNTDEPKEGQFLICGVPEGYCIHKFWDNTGVSSWYYLLGHFPTLEAAEYALLAYIERAKVEVHYDETGARISGDVR